MWAMRSEKSKTMKRGEYSVLTNLTLNNTLFFRNLFLDIQRLFLLDVPSIDECDLRLRHMQGFHIRQWVTLIYVIGESGSRCSARDKHLSFYRMLKSMEQGGS